MKRIYFYFFLMMLFCPSISWAAVNYTSVNFSGTLVADDNPIVRVLNFDGTHRATSKATLRGRITVGCTVSAGSYGTLDIALTGSIRKGDTSVDTVAGTQDHLIGGGPLFPTSVAESHDAYGRNYNPDPSAYDPAYETDQTGTYVLNGKATITRSGSGGINAVKYHGVGGGVSDPTTYASQVGQQIDSVVVTMRTQTLGESVSGNACRVMVISSSGAVSLDEGCDGGGTCPPRQWDGGMQRRNGRCGGDFCNCNSGSSDSGGEESSSGCSQSDYADWCNDQGTCSEGSSSGVPGPICGENWCCCSPNNDSGGDPGSEPGDSNSGSSSGSDSSDPGCSNNPDYNYCTDDGTCSEGSDSGVPGPICGQNYCCCDDYQ